jgi:hypothetical protein
MAGEIQLNGTSFCSESGGTITVNNGTIGSSVVFPAGHVIQVVYAESTTSTSITSTTQGSGTSTGLSATITPVSSSNKFFISYVGSFMLAYAPSPGLSVEIYDGSSVVATENQNWGIYINSVGDEYDNNYKYPFQTYITPSSSGSITYTVRAWKQGAAATAQPNSRLSTLTIMEIQQ